MAQWYESNRKLFREERKALAAACPLLRLVVVGPGFEVNSKWCLKQECAVVHGAYHVNVPYSCRQIAYGIVLVLPNNYPRQAPEMFCNDLKLPIGDIDRHVMQDGRACLGVQGEIGMRWPAGSGIVDFLENLVAPFLVWQAYFDAFQQPPPWGQRSHHKQGILEFYAELLGWPADSSLVDFMRLLARKNRPKGHEPCPCNSGKKLRDCHRDVLYEARDRIAWQDVERDLGILLRKEVSK